MFYIDNNTQTIDKYDLAKFMDFQDDYVFNCIDSYMLYEIPKLPTVGTYTIRKEQNNPPLLSYNIYGDTQYWWILMWYNHFLKPQDLKSGTIIKYPSLSALEQLYMNACLQQKVNS